MLRSYPFISSCCFPLISCREWLPRHVPKGSTSRESSWRSLSAGSRFTVKDQGWVACQRARPVAELRRKASASCCPVNLQYRTSRGQTLARLSSQRLPGPPSCEPGWQGWHISTTAIPARRGDAAEGYAEAKCAIFITTFANPFPSITQKEAITSFPQDSLPFSS